MDKKRQKPKRSRRKEARPYEILSAALDEFVEHGFASAKLAGIAKRAGVAKGTLYLYFDTKEDLFRAVVEQAVAGNLQNIEEATKVFGGSLIEFIPVLLEHAAGAASDSRVPALARLVIGESRLFPDLARIWHDNVLAKIFTLLTQMITQAQAKKEIKAGDPHAIAFSIIGPMVMAILFNEVFDASSPYAPRLSTLARQHGQIILHGLNG